MEPLIHQSEPKRPIMMLAAADVKGALRAIRDECVSGMAPMHAVDEQWRALFGDSADAPWKFPPGSHFNPLQARARELLARRVDANPGAPPSDELLRDVLTEAERELGGEGA